jgi:acetyl/propionyl-CoA carboxylase alpha subunit
MFKKVLIANRGEIAARVARTCKRLGMDTVAVYSDADADGVHCHACDEAVHIGPADAHASYLNVPALLAAAASTGADVIHPGYGLLSESPAFAQAVLAAGLAFVGPTPELMSKLLDREKSREIALNAGVRGIDGSERTWFGSRAEPRASTEDAAEVAEAAEALGYPLVVKPVRGGGGIGPALVREPEELAAAIERTHERAQELFADGRVYLERALSRARHVEVQIVADSHGDLVCVGDRECSIQRNGLRLLDESPAPALLGSERAERTRDAIWDAALRFAREAGFVGAGAVEFLIDTRGEAYFLEMRPRLQVAHGITEMCANVDLVEAQMVVAAGGPIPPEIKRAIPSGHAMEVRLTAEQVNRGFAPATGTVTEVRWPNASPGRLRIEASIQPGSKVTTDYDTMVAKVITYAPTRHAALLLLDRVLAESAIVPLPTNSAFLRRILGHESFRAAQYDVSFVEQLLKK